MNKVSCFVIRGLVLTATILSLSCGGEKTPIAPSQPGGSGISTSVVFDNPAGGTYTAQLNGQTYTARGSFTVSLPQGTAIIDGTFNGPAFAVAFLRLQPTGGGVLSGSVQSLAGPRPSVGQCRVIYDNFDTPNTSRNFRVQFTVTANVASACQF